MDELSRRVRERLLDISEGRAGEVELEPEEAEQLIRDHFELVTPERHEFERTVWNDPIAHMITTMHLHAWADGYEQGIRDTADASKREVERLYDLSFHDICQLALERLTEQRREFDRAQLLAVAELAKLAPRPLA